MLLQLIVSSLCVVTNALQTLPSEDFYYGAVVEYHPLKGQNGNDTLLQNAEQYVKIINEASKYTDIVVFPEASLLYGDSSVFVRIPFGNGSNAPADDDSLHPALQMLSLAARNNSIYVAINIHETYESSNETLHYNTNVVFNRSGAIVARYRKYNLFSEVQYINITETPDYMFFDTDFGVRFGTFTCFDILFKEPTLKLKDYNVTDYIFPTWWFSELPHLTAIQEQAAWSYATDSNLLASGGNYVSFGSSGSGIYNGKKGPIVYMQTNKNGVSLLTAKIYKKGRNGISVGEIREITTLIKETAPEKMNTSLKMKTEVGLKDYVTFHLTPDLNILMNDQYFMKNNFSYNFITEKELCQGDFCCFYSINMTVFYKNVTGDLLEKQRKSDRFYNYEYKLGIFNGVRTFDGFATGGIQVCSIIPCLNRDQSSCGKTTNGIPFLQINSTNFLNNSEFITVFNRVVIKTTTLDKTAFAEPTIIKSSLQPEMFGSLMKTNQYTFDQQGSTAELRLSSEKLGSAGIFARIFSRDGSDPGVNSSSSYVICFNILLIFPLLLLVIKLEQ